MFKRSIGAIVTAPFQARHWRAVINTFRLLPRPIAHLQEYVTRSQAGFPKTVDIRTPTGKITAQLHHPDDRLTVNEIFCRGDYEVPQTAQTIVDFGSNIGISALYFLSRNASAKVWLYEPNPANVEKLRAQVASFEDRVVLNPVGVAPEDGVLEFGFEPSGRYGGAGLDFPDKQSIAVEAAERVLADIIADTGGIDVVKLDIESLEEDILRSLTPDTVSKVKLFLIEGPVATDMFQDTHEATVYGPITRLTRR